MAIGAAVLLGTSANPNDLTAYNTTVVTPTAGRLVRVDIVNSHGSAAVEATIASGQLGITNWTKIASLGFFTNAAPTKFLTCFRGFSASPSGTTLTVGFAGAQTSCGVAVYEFPGVETASPIGQVVTNFSDANGTAASATLSALTSAGNALNCAIGLNANTAVTERASWTEIADVPITTPTARLQVQGRLGVSDNASGTFATSRWGIIAMQLVETGAAPIVMDVPDGIIYRTRWRRRW